MIKTYFLTRRAADNLNRFMVQISKHEFALLSIARIGKVCRVRLSKNEFIYQILI